MIIAVRFFATVLIAKIIPIIAQKSVKVIAMIAKQTAKTSRLLRLDYCKNIPNNCKTDRNNRKRDRNNRNNDRKQYCDYYIFL